MASHSLLFSPSGSIERTVRPCISLCSMIQRNKVVLPDPISPRISVSECGGGGAGIETGGIREMDIATVVQVDPDPHRILDRHHPAGRQRDEFLKLLVKQPGFDRQNRGIGCRLAEDEEVPGRE